MRMQRDKRANTKALDEDLYIEANVQIYPADKDATINVCGLLNN